MQESEQPENPEHEGTSPPAHLDPAAGPKDYTYGLPPIHDSPAQRGDSESDQQTPAVDQEETEESASPEQGQGPDTLEASTPNTDPLSVPQEQEDWGTMHYPREPQADPNNEPGGIDPSAGARHVTNPELFGFLQNFEVRIDDITQKFTNAVEPWLNQIQNSIDILPRDDSKNLEIYKQALNDVRSAILEDLQARNSDKDQLNLNLQQRNTQLEKQREEMSQELTQYREGSRGNEVEDFVVEYLFPLYDDMSGAFISLDADGEGPENPLHRYKNDAQTLLNQLLGIFDSLGIQQFEATTDVYAREEQEVDTSIPTNTEEKNRKIVKRVRKGFKTETKILRKERVEIYRFEREEAKPE